MRRKILPLVLCAVVLLLILGRLFFFHTLQIKGQSMNNTLEHDDYVLVFSLLGRTPDRGDIVECSFPNRDGTYVKRVIGLPGERIEIIDGDTYADGQLLREKYVSSRADDYSIQLNDGQYLLLGDNRAESYDSRAEEIGPAYESNFIGKVVFSLWPFKSIS